jgi:uncharacterized protein YqeY
VIKEDIYKQLNDARKEKDTSKLNLLGYIYGEIQKKEREGKTTIEFDDDKVIALLKAHIKKAKGNVELYAQSNETEKAAQEQSEIDILETFLPEQISEADLKVAVQAVIDSGVEPEMKNMGKIIGAVRAQFKAKGQEQAVDGKLLSDVVKASLA